MQEKIEQRPFDPSAPHDAMSDSFRRQIIQMVIDAQGVTIYREMSLEDQLSSFMSGALTAIVGIALSSVHPRAHDVVMMNILKALPAARKQAEDIMKNAGR